MLGKVIFTPPQDLIEFLRSVQDQLSDFSPAMSDVSTALKVGVQNNWRSSGSGTWRPHAPTTNERWGPHALLRLGRSDGGPLVENITRRYNAFGALVVGAPHSILHEYGRGRGWRAVKAHEQKLFGKDGRPLSKRGRKVKNGRRRSERYDNRYGLTVDDSLEMPARFLFYITDETADKCTDIILDFLFKKVGD